MTRLRMTRAGVPLVLTACISNMAGCAGIQLEDEYATHYLILGLGMVSVPDGNPTGTRAVRTHTLGASVSAGVDKALTLGYAHKTRLVIPADAENTCMEIADTAGGIMRVQTCDAFLKETATTISNIHCP